MKGYNMPNVLAYELDKKIYINLTNRCTNDCIFCLRKDKDDVCGQGLWLENEEFSAQDVITQINELVEKDFGQSSSVSPLMPPEIIFCGYGEPLLKLDILKEVAEYIKKTYRSTKIRVNTNGHANYVYKRNIVPELKGLVDEFSVSLNGSDSAEYDKYSQPKFDNAYDEVKKFIKSCTDTGISTVATVVDGYKGKRINIKKCEQIALNLGAKFRVREWIQGGY